MKGQISLGEDAKIIHINLEPSFGDHVSKDVVHEGLKCRWCIAEAKEHDNGFKESKGGDECRFPLIGFPDINVVVPPTDVKLGAKGGVFHVVNEFRDER